MRRVAVVAAFALALAFLLFGGGGTGNDGNDGNDGSPAPGRSARVADPRGDAIRSAAVPIGAPDGAVIVSGTVRDAATYKPVGGVEVVLRGIAITGDESTVALADGTFRVAVPPGVYRAFVRDDTVLSVGHPGRVRLPGLPTPSAAGVPDESLMPLVVAIAGATGGYDLTVTRGGVVTGRVLDRSGNPIAGAAVRARASTGIRPTLGTDIAESDATGAYELRLPEGSYGIEATHPRFAGVEDAAPGGLPEDGTSDRPAGRLPPGGMFGVTAGERITQDVTLVAGCVITGRVVGANGAASGDGAIEKRWGTTALEFAPSGRIEAGGTFRWVTTEEGDVTLRAWPWKSPPSEGKTFACRDGARFEVAFAIPDQRPDIEGTLVDAHGAPVALAFVDLVPLDPGGINQQERTDADGRWGVYFMPAGRYRITAHAPGRGVVSQTVASPQASVALRLGGTGRIEGTTARMDSGSFELELRACVDRAGLVALHGERRLVSVSGGKFTLDDVPACELLHVAARWHASEIATRVAVPADGVGKLALAIGPARAKTVRGVVRLDGRPAAGAQVHALASDGEEARTASDASGRYELRTYEGARVSASAGTGASVHVAGEGAADEVIDFDVAPAKPEPSD